MLEPSSPPPGPEDAPAVPLAGPVVASGKGQFIGREVRSWIKAFVIALTVFLVLRIFIFDINEVSGTSMEPGFTKGDKVFVDKLSLRFGEIRAGDVIVFTKPDGSKRLIKRVVARPGDRLDGREGRLYVNGTLLDEAYVRSGNEARFRTLALRDGQLVVDGRLIATTVHPGDHVYAGGPAPADTVPDDMFLVLGDNRAASLDSITWGLLARDLVIGRVLFRFRLWPAAKAAP
ncbi:MAG: signal peptidase I [Planctomycetota bacterium]